MLLRGVAETRMKWWRRTKVVGLWGRQAYAAGWDDGTKTSWGAWKLANSPITTNNQPKS